MDPLPHLCAADLGRRGILHQVVQRHRALAAQPRFNVLHAHPHVLAQARFGAGALVHFQQILLGDVHIFAQPVQLVGLGHEPVEDFLGDGHQVRMRHPGAIVTIAGFPFLVRAHPGHGSLIGGGIAAIRDLGRHAAHGEGAAAVAGLDQQQ